MENQPNFFVNADSCRLPLAKMHCLPEFESVGEQNDESLGVHRTFGTKGTILSTQRSWVHTVDLAAIFPTLFPTETVGKMSPSIRSVFLSIWKDFAINNSNEGRKVRLTLKGFPFREILFVSLCRYPFLFANSFRICRSTKFHSFKVEPREKFSYHFPAAAAGAVDQLQLQPAKRKKFHYIRNFVSRRKPGQKSAKEKQ